MLTASKYCCEMEDEVKIFIAGVRKISNIKGLTQIDIYKGIKWPVGLNGSQGTISSYFVGRTRPKKEVMFAIADFLDMGFDEILTIGRKELQPKVTELTGQDIRNIIDGTLSERLDEILKTQTVKTMPPGNVEIFKDTKNAEHHRTVDKFKDQETALEINNILVKIESIEPATLKKIRKTLQIELEALEETKRKDSHEPGKPGERPSKRA